MLMERLLAKFNEMHTENAGLIVDKTILAQAIRFNYLADVHAGFNLRVVDEYISNNSLSTDIAQNDTRVALEQLFLPHFNTLDRGTDPEYYDILFLTIHDGLSILASMNSYIDPDSVTAMHDFEVMERVAEQRVNITAVANRLVNPALLRNYLDYMPEYLAAEQGRTEHNIIDDHNDGEYFGDGSDDEDEYSEDEDYSSDEESGAVGGGAGAAAEAVAAQPAAGAAMQATAVLPEGATAQVVPGATAAQAEVPLAIDVVAPLLPPQMQVRAATDRAQALADGGAGAAAVGTGVPVDTTVGAWGVPPIVHPQGAAMVQAAATDNAADDSDDDGWSVDPHAENFVEIEAPGDVGVPLNLGEQDVVEVGVGVGVRVGDVAFVDNAFGDFDVDDVLGRSSPLSTGSSSVGFISDLSDL